MEIKKNIPNNTITRKLVDLDKETGNIYEINSLASDADNNASASAVISTIYIP